MADKRQQQQGPQNYSAHGICIYCVILPASDKGGGGEEEKMEDRLLHSCIFTLTCLIRKRGRGEERERAGRCLPVKPSISAFQ